MTKIFLKTVQILVALSLICAMGCKKDKPEGRSLTCSITSPQNGEELSVYDDFIVTVDAKDSNGSITAVMVYLDTLPCGTAMTAPYTVTISSDYLSLGSHKLKAVAINDVATQKESATITITIIDDGGGDENESPNFVTFANGDIPPSWRTSSWEVDVAMGYDDGYSLKSKEYPASVLTNKTMKAPGYIEFYTRGDNFDLYIDKVKKEAFSFTPDGNWTKWIYDVGQGKHEFLWETTLGASVYLDAITFAAAKLPEVTTKEVTNITSTSATSGGNITNSGNNPVTARGVCWSTSENPTINDNKTTNGSGTGSFTSNITELNRDTRYYMRAYATNGVGTAYGEQISFTTFSEFLLAIGDEYQGGIIAYIDNTGEHGLIAAPKDQSTGIQWWNGSYILTSATGTAIGTGQSNTTKIVQAQGVGNYAAKLCDDLVLNGYDDWFLPSKDELNILYQNRDLIGGFSTGYDDFYSSSSEYDYEALWGQWFYTGEQNYWEKHYNDRVRAVRYF